jgi:hypothetical protein
MGFAVIISELSGASMSEAIWIALIGAAAVILAAVLPPIVRALLPRRVAQRLEDAEKQTEDAISRAGGDSGDEAIFQRKLFLALGLGEVAVGLIFYLATSIEMQSGTRFGLFILLVICSVFWLFFLIYVYMAGFVQWSLAGGPLKRCLSDLFVGRGDCVSGNKLFTRRLGYSVLYSAAHSPFCQSTRRVDTTSLSPRVLGRAMEMKVWWSLASRTLFIRAGDNPIHCGRTPKLNIVSPSGTPTLCESASSARALSAVILRCGLRWPAMRCPA